MAGLELALAVPYDAAVIDLMLPQLDGLALIAEVRRRKVTTPVIILSAKRSVDDRVKGLYTGSDDYLTKPFAFTELLARVQALIRRATGAAEPIRLSGERAVTGTESWIKVRAKGKDEVLEIASMWLPDGSLLPVGKSTEDRDELLEAFGWIVLGILIPVVGGGVIGGMFLAFRALRPVRHLIETVRAIEAGTMGSSVPTRQTDDELDELGRLFNTMLEKIAALIQGMRNALDDVAHDLRTPMTRVRGIAELALTAEADLATCREALADCVEEADRVRTLLDTLMDISEAETGTMTLDLDVVHLPALLEDAVDLYRDVAAEKDISVSTSVPRELCLRADRHRLRQVLANLLDNALKYTAPGAPSP